MIDTAASLTGVLFKGCKAGMQAELIWHGHGGEATALSFFCCFSLCGRSRFSPEEHSVTWTLSLTLRSESKHSTSSINAT